jgi:uncharacterized protein
MDLKVYSSDRSFAALVLAHGAGAGQLSQFMVRTAQELAERGLTTATFDFSYITSGRKVPDRANVLEDAWTTAVEHARKQFGAMPLFIGGKSMGGRIASHVAAQARVGRIAGLVFLGYPLHPPGKLDQRRDAHLPGIAEPMLFVQGSRDPFGTSEEIAALLPRLTRAALHEVAGGDHSFKVPGGKGKQEPAFQEVMNAVAAWTRAVIAQ